MASYENENRVIEMKTNLTIVDYFERSAPDLYGTRNSRLISPRNPLTRSRFGEILNALKSGKKTANSSRPQGLTLSYYINHPVNVRSIKTLHHISDPTSTKSLSATGSPKTGTGEAFCKSEPHTTEASHTGLNDSALTSPTPPATTSDEDAGETTIRQKIDSCIDTAARKYNVPSELIRGVIRAESDFCYDAVSRAGAQGLMQLMPGTARELGVVDPFDVDQNIDGGVRYLKKMMNQFKGDVKLALAAYNAGPGAVRRYQGIPPYKETIQYVKRVLEYSQKNRIT